jgi:predicted methyltransferase
MTRRRRQRREPPVVETCRMCGGKQACLRDPADLRETVAPWLRRRPLLCDRCAAQLAVPRRREREEEGAS